MHKLSYLAVVLLFVSCGGAEESSDESTSETVDTTSVVDTTTVDSTEMSDEIQVQYFEDYAQFDSKTKLYEYYGADALKDDTAWYAEGTEMFLSTTLTDPETGYLIRFVWEQDDNETLNSIETWHNTWFEENPKDQRIETIDGLYTGMPITELVEWNGSDFTFSGFGWDYAGGVMPEVGSKLASSEVSVTLDMSMEGYSTYGHLIGDVLFNTGDENVQGAPIVVGMMTMYLTEGH